MLSGILLMLQFSCNQKNKADDQDFYPINISHLDHLYADVILKNGAEAGIIHIYSEYPDYDFTIEPREGFTCVDDVARAVVFLTELKPAPNETKVPIMITRMVEFILSMQAENGYFYNFLWNDMTINRDYKTSRPEPNWWSWRAFWALEKVAAIKLYDDPRLTNAIDKLVTNIKQAYLMAPMNLKTFAGMQLPEWLPHGAAGDQTAVLIIALEKYYQRTHDAEALRLIEKFAAGLLYMQQGNSHTFPYGAFLSWNHLWHAYGSSQAYAMLKAGQVLEREDLINSALLEIDNFYPWVAEQGFLSYFRISFDGNDYILEEKEKFPQIAYGIRPMVFACLEAYKVTKDEKYETQAEQIARWFSGDNPYGRPMFDPNTGRCYDGIISADDINLNAGAESTSEAQLALNKILTKHPKNDIRNVYQRTE